MPELITVRLTRFLENKDYRLRLQRTIEMPVAPHVGWLFSGCTASSFVKLSAEIVVWNHQEQLIDCICGTGMMKDGPAELKNHAETHYGKEWAIENPIKLTMDAPRHII